MAKRITEVVAVGDEVRYTALFLRSTGQYSGDVPQRRGVVTALKDLGGAMYATVSWHGHPAGMVNTFNICRINDRRSYAD